MFLVSKQLVRSTPAISNRRSSNFSFQLQNPNKLPVEKVLIELSGKEKIPALVNISNSTSQALLFNLLHLVE